MIDMITTYYLFLFFCGVFSDVKQGRGYPVILMAFLLEIPKAGRFFGIW